MKMLKTNKENLAKPSTFLILLGVLKGYLNYPLLFLIGTKITFKKFRKKIKLELPNDFIETAGFIAWIYIRLKDKIGQEKAFEIVRAGVLTSGLAVQQASFRNVACQRNFANLKKYQQKTNQEGTTKLNTMEVVEDSETKYEFRVTRCLFHEFYTYLEVPELTAIMCAIDNAIFNSYLPEKLIFHRNGQNKRMSDGNESCTFVIENREV